MIAISILLGLVCLYVVVMAVRDVFYWFDSRHWQAYTAEIVSTGVLAIVFLGISVAFFHAAFSVWRDG